MPERPLLARQQSDSSSRRAEEEDALLTGRPTHKTENRKQKWREIGAWSWAALTTIAMIVLAVAFAREKQLAEQAKAGKCGSNKKPEGKRNLVFMVTDGMGPASLELARTFRQFTQDLPHDDILTLDKHLIGSHRTRSSNSLITDSAAGATAFSCGFKSYNGAISVLPDHTPCGTVLEAAKKAGYMTGLVVTTRVTDATPACFGSHVQSRRYEDLIAEQLLGYYPLGRMVDVLVGGGRCHFLPNTTKGSCREDDKDLVAMAKEDGWNYIDNKKDFSNLNPKGGVKLPLLALVASHNVPFEIDRQHIDDEYPSQYEMATLALAALKAATVDKDKGYFIMIEGSRIDLAGHNNDPAAQAHEILIHDRTLNAVLDFLKEDDAQGVMVSTSDHETGGLSMARQLTTHYPKYIWYPEVLANATHSASYLDKEWKDYIRHGGGDDATHAEKSRHLSALLQRGLGFTPTAQELDAVIANGVAHGNPVTPSNLFADMISRRAGIAWATHGHSAVDVNVYGSDPAYMSQIVGNHENVEIGRFLADYLDVDVDAVTRELRRKNVQTRPGELGGSDGDNDKGPSDLAWTGPVLGDGEVVGVDVDDYHTGM